MVRNDFFFLIFHVCFLNLPFFFVYTVLYQHEVHKMFMMHKRIDGSFYLKQKIISRQSCHI